MTATDELRRLLDERGVEWWEEYGFTYWKNKFGYSCNCATGHESGMVSVLFDAKPEQAVEATLGRGTCRMTHIEDEERILHGWMECSECGPVYPPAAERIQDAVKFCPFCGRKVVDA